MSDNRKKQLDIKTSAKQLRSIRHQMAIDFVTESCAAFAGESFAGVDFVIVRATEFEMSVLYKDKVVFKIEIDESIDNYDKDDYYHNNITRTIHDTGYDHVNYCSLNQFYAMYDSRTVFQFFKFEWFSVHHYGIYSDVLSGQVNTVKTHLLEGIVNDVKSEMDKNEKHALCISQYTNADTNANTAVINVKKCISIDHFDTRFFTIEGHKPQGMNVDGEMCRSETFNITEDTLFDDILKFAQLMDLELQAIFKSCYDKYDEVEKTVGGCMVTLDVIRSITVVRPSFSTKVIKLLTHRGVMPIANNAFFTFKCPYTNDMITKNISGTESIVIKGMDEFHPNTMQVPLLG